jgi:putative endonuclease
MASKSVGDNAKTAKDTLSTEFWVYILKCSDDTLYTGWTTNLDERVKTHNAGTGAKYTRSRLPVSLVYTEQLESKSAAMRREYEIKLMSKVEKLALINIRD